MSHLTQVSKQVGDLAMQANVHPWVASHRGAQAPQPLTSFPLYSELSVELKREVLTHLGVRDLARFARTSRESQDIALEPSLPLRRAKVMNAIRKLAWPPTPENKTEDKARDLLLKHFTKISRACAREDACFWLTSLKEMKGRTTGNLETTRRSEGNCYRALFFPGILQKALEQCSPPIAAPRASLLRTNAYQAHGYSLNPAIFSHAVAGDCLSTAYRLLIFDVFELQVALRAETSRPLLPPAGTHAEVEHWQLEQACLGGLNFIGSVMHADLLLNGPRYQLAELLEPLFGDVDGALSETSESNERRAKIASWLSRDLGASLRYLAELAPELPDALVEALGDTMGWDAFDEARAYGDRLVDRYDVGRYMTDGLGLYHLLAAALPEDWFTLEEIPSFSL